MNEYDVMPRKDLPLLPHTHKKQKHVFWNNIGRSENESEKPEIPAKAGRFSSMVQGINELSDMKR